MQEEFQQQAAINVKGNQMGPRYAVLTGAQHMLQGELRVTGKVVPGQNGLSVGL